VIFKLEEWVNVWWIKVILPISGWSDRDD